MTGESVGWSTSSALLQTAAVLFFIIFLIILLFWLVRRFGLNRLLSNLHGTPQIQILNRVTLGPRQSLVITRLMNEIYILGVGDNSVNLLAGPYSEEEWNKYNKQLDGEIKRSENFSGIFKRLIKQR